MQVNLSANVLDPVSLGGKVNDQYTLNRDITLRLPDYLFQVLLFFLLYCANIKCHEFSPNTESYLCRLQLKGAVVVLHNPLLIIDHVHAEFAVKVFPDITLENRLEPF